MKMVSIYEAKTHFSQLVDAVLAGEEVVVCRRDQPVVVLAAYRETQTRRQIGAAKGLILKMEPSFNDPLEDWEESIHAAPSGSVKRRGRKS